MLNRDHLLQLLEPFANSVVARYGHPVYLVGSAIDALDAYALRDVDVVCVLPDAEFVARFGGHWTHAQSPLPDPVSSRWAAEVGKLSRQSGLRNINLDFKVQCDEWVEHRHKGKPRVRIDRCELGVTTRTQVRDALQRSARHARELAAQLRKVFRAG